MNVFVRLAPSSTLRSHLAAAVVAALQPWVQPVTLIAHGACEKFWPQIDGYPPVDWLWAHDDFHLVSKRRAAELAMGDYLIILDDDQLPLYKDWIGYAEYLTKRFPEYAAIAGWSVTNEVPRPDALVEESDSIGCPMIVRRSALLDATAEPINNTARADTIITARLQRHGKTGIARNWRYNHLGMGYSQVIPQHWMPECPV